MHDSHIPFDSTISGRGLILFENWPWLSKCSKKFLRARRGENLLFAAIFPLYLCASPEQTTGLNSPLYLTSSTLDLREHELSWLVGAQGALCAGLSLLKVT